MNNKAPTPFTLAIVITSDRASKGEYTDKTTPLLLDLFNTLHYKIQDTLLIPDDENTIVKTLQTLIKKHTQYIFTSGGTGISPRDVTPEATRRVIEKEIPGIPEMLRAKSLAKTPYAVTSRAVCGSRQQSIILNAPGSSKGALDYAQWANPAIKHMLKILRSSNQDPHMSTD